MLQAAVSLAAVGAAAVILPQIGLDQNLVPLFQQGVAGAMFHVFTAMAMTLLLLFDFRRMVCYLALAFAACSGISTYLFMQLGPHYYGYGYCLSAILFFVITLFILIRALRMLPYYTLVVNNEST